MTQCVAFTTPGLIPLEAFTTFGVNAKPNSSNPFGYFGTGLKYAVAVCLRNGCKVELIRGGTRYTFYSRLEDFRGKDFDFVRMKKHRAIPGTFHYSKLPFTLELGKNWELWQAFRELETNTRDEGGVTQLEYWDDRSTHVHDNRTTILVFGSKFVDEYHEMGRHFLADGKVVREDEAIQVIDRPSKSVYYRGVRIMDLKEEAEFTYNILSTVELTEDRTAKYPFMIEQLISQYWLESEDEERVQRVATTTRWESRGLSYSYAYSTPSRAWTPEVTSKVTNPTLKQHLKDKEPTVSTTTTIQIVIPRPDITPNEMADIVRAVEGVLGLEDIKVLNMNTDEEIGGEELVF